MATSVGPWRIDGESKPTRSGAAYAVSHGENGTRAVLEVYDVAPLAFSSYSERLRPLMHALDRLGPGAVKLYDVGTLPGGGRPYVVRESVDGALLSDLVASSTLPEPDVIAIMRAICGVLVDAHEKGIVHRSLSVDTVIVHTNGVKLLDWGIADELAKQTKPGETATRHRSCPSDDVYAFGVMMHRLLRWVPRALEALWVSMLSKDPAARPTMRDVARHFGDPSRPTAPRVTTSRVTKPRIATGSTPPPHQPRTAKVHDIVRTTQPGVAPPQATPVTVRREVARATPGVVEAPPPAIVEEPCTSPSVVDEAVATPAVIEARPATLDHAPITIEDRAPAITESDPSLDIPPTARPTWHVFVLATTIAVVVIAAALTATNALQSRPTAPAHEQPPAVAQPTITPPSPIIAEAPTAPTMPEAAKPAPTPAAAPTAVVETKAAAPVAAQKVVSAKRTVTPKRTKTVAAATASASDAKERGALLAKYQRVRRDLLLAKRDLGPDAVAHVSQRLQHMKLDLALATKTSRRIMGNTLDQLQSQIKAARTARR